MRNFRVLLYLAFVLSLSTAVYAQKSKPLAENFNAVSMEGFPVDLASQKGKIVVLTFWTTRCAICQTELPKVNRLAAQYRSNNVVFLGLTTDNVASVQNYIKKNPFNVEILPNSFSIFMQYAEKDSQGRINMGFPTHFLINQNGEIEFKTSGFDKTEQLDAGINRLLKTNLAKNE